jgi:hypothetical protein
MNIRPAPCTPTRMLVLLMRASCSENPILEVSTTWGNDRRGVERISEKRRGESKDKEGGGKSEVRSKRRRQERTIIRLLRLDEVSFYGHLSVP